MAKYTIEDIKSWYEMGIINEETAKSFIKVIMAVDDNHNCPAAESDTNESSAAESELKHLVDRYGLPLKVKMPRFYGDFYFLAENIDECRHMIDGQQFRDGKFYRNKSYAYSEICSLLEPKTIERMSATNSIQETDDSPNITSERIKISGSDEDVERRPSKTVAHWFDRYIEEFKEDCLECGFDDDCDGNCLWCDVLNDHMVDDIGVHNNIWPYDYNSQEAYVAACEFANEADEIVSGEEMCWWRGDPGYIQGISSPAIDPRDFSSEDQYKEALYRHLFKEAIMRYPVIPNTALWFRAYVNFLKATESIFCADKSILALLDELNYSDSDQFVVQCGSEDHELDHEIQYNSWKEPRFEPRYSSDYLVWRTSCFFQPYWDREDKKVRRRRKEYTESQFRNDLYYHYPELFTFINDILHPPSTWRGIELTQTEKNIQEYIDDVLIFAFYLNDLYDFSVEDSVQNGLMGLLNGLKNGFWQQQSSFWKKEEYLIWEIQVSMIQYSPELADHFGFVIDRKIAKLLSAVIYRHRPIDNISVGDLCDNYRVTEQEYYIKDKIAAFFETKNATAIKVSLEDKDNTTINFLSEEERMIDPEKPTFRCQLAKTMRELLETLTAQESYVLRMRFGMYDGIDHSLEEIGQRLDVTRERIRQIENKAIRKLRHPSRAKKIKDFYC